MFGIFSAAGDALRAFGNLHPAIKWGVIALAGLLAVEFVGKEAVSLYVAMSTARGQVERQNAENRYEQWNKTTTLEYQSKPMSEIVKALPPDPISTAPAGQDAAVLPDSLKIGDPSKLSPEDRAKLRSVSPYGNPPPDLKNTK